MEIQSNKIEQGKKIEITDWQSLFVAPLESDVWVHRVKISDDPDKATSGVSVIRNTTFVAFEALLIFAARSPENHYASLAEILRTQCECSESDVEEVLSSLGRIGLENGLYQKPSTVKRRR